MMAASPAQHSMLSIAMRPMSKPHAGIASCSALQSYQTSVWSKQGIADAIHLLMQLVCQIVAFQLHHKHVICKTQLQRVAVLMACVALIQQVKC